MGKLDGQVAAVTGGSRGIGAGIVRALLDEGASVAFNGRSAEAGAALVAELGLPERVWFCQGSVKVTEDINALIDGAVEPAARLGGDGGIPVAKAVKMPDPVKGFRVARFGFFQIFAEGGLEVARFIKICRRRDIRPGRHGEQDGETRRDGNKFNKIAFYQPTSFSKAHRWPCWPAVI